MFASLRSTARIAMAAGQRAGACRRSGHSWTDRADPPACTRCGRTKTTQDEPPVAA